jgi:hypothetical protein
VRELLPAPTVALFAEYDSKSVRKSRSRLCKQRRNFEIAEWRAADVRVRLAMSHFWLPLAFLPMKEALRRDRAFLLPKRLQIVPR